MHEIISRIAIDALFLLTGYAAHFVWKDLLLERKRRRLHALAEELCEEAAGLKRREDELRLRWQRMVEQMSRLRAEAFDDDPREWSEADDAFLASWISADK